VAHHFSLLVSANREKMREEEKEQEHTQ
jgi:hypothetical protein